MLPKLNYARPTSARARRTARELLTDTIAGAGPVIVGLFITIFLSVVTSDGGSRIDEQFERPRTMVRRGVTRIAKGEAARNDRP
jgi:hypothetical protein